MNQKLVILRDNGNTMEDGSGYDVKSDGAAFESSSLEGKDFFIQGLQHSANVLIFSLSKPLK